jgi:hypothetical protein
MKVAGAAGHAIAEVERGDPREGLARYRAWQIARVEEARAAGRLPPMTAAAIYASAGQADRAFDWLERALVTRDAMLVLLASHPDFDPVRTDPRFPELMRRMGFGA